MPLYSFARHGSKSLQHDQYNSEQLRVTYATNTTLVGRIFVYTLHLSFITMVIDFIASNFDLIYVSSSRLLNNEHIWAATASASAPTRPWCATARHSPKVLPTSLSSSSSSSSTTTTRRRCHRCISSFHNSDFQATELTLTRHRPFEL